MGPTELLLLLLFGVIIYVFFIKPRQKKRLKKNKYTALIIVATIIDILGGIVIVLGVFGLLYSTSEGILSEGVLLYGIGSLLGILIGILLIAISNLIAIFIDIEYNTRKLHNIDKYFKEEEKKETLPENKNGTDKGENNQSPE